MNDNLKKFILIVLVVGLAAAALIFWAGRTKAPTTENKSQNAETNSSQSSVSAQSVSVSQSSLSSQSESVGSTSSAAGIDPVALAKYMTAQGMTLYGAYWCPHCKDQKALFGDALQYVKYVECDDAGPSAQPGICAAEGITGYPTWRFQGKSYPGSKTFSELATIVGYTQLGN
ncbi:MAG: hypothetical protein WCG48_02630 [Candidatus Berkelbacteria bacterium]